MLSNMKTQNNALLMKHLDKFYNQADIPWVNLTWTKFYSNYQTPPQARSLVGSFWWKDIMKLFDKFRLATCHPHRGKVAIFWSDHWMGEALKDTYPQLFSFTTKPKCSIRYFLDQVTDRKFTLPLSTQAAAQFEELQALLLERVWDDNLNDIWSYS